MNSHHEMIPIEKVKLDRGNPRIALILEKYGEDVPSDAISLALNGGSPDAGTTYEGLKESIKTSGGIIHPIIVNKLGDEYVVIEGNTRVQIYIEFRNSGVKGNWDEIPAIVYENMDAEFIHSIRLQSHLVGPRAWDPYAKAKYLHFLSTKELLPMGEIVSFAGGRQSEVVKMIKAYDDMETHYRSQLPDDDAFDQKKFSFFQELQNKKTTDALIYNGFTKKDYALWVINENIDKANVAPRRLGQILANKEARAVFLKSNATEALKIIDAISMGAITDSSVSGIAVHLSSKLMSLQWPEARRIIHNESEVDILRGLRDDIEEFLSNADITDSND